MGQTDFYATVLGPPSVGQNPPGGGKMGQTDFYASARRSFEIVVSKLVVNLIFYSPIGKRGGRTWLFRAYAQTRCAWRMTTRS
jgi:hypothetical protein